MLIKLQDISKHYGNESDGTVRKVLDSLSLDIREGESIAILGPSGSGKTTLLNIMGALDRPDSGDLFFKETSTTRDSNKAAEDEFDNLIINNHDDLTIAARKAERRTAPTPSVERIAVGTNFASPSSPVAFTDKENLIHFSAAELDRFRNEKIGFVFQLHHLFPQCTLLENILIPTLTLRDPRTKAERIDRARQLMERVGIWEHRDRQPGHLSGGECQRAAVVRALINRPGLILADEPTGALDEENANRLTDLLLEINQQDRVTLVVVTHSIAMASRMDKMYTLRNGKLKLKVPKA